LKRKFLSFWKWEVIKMAKLTIHTRDRDRDQNCPPHKDINGRTKIDAAWNYFEQGKPTPVVLEVEPGSHRVFFKPPYPNSDCFYEPVEGQQDVQVPPQGLMVCADYKCTSARDAILRLSGTYNVKRDDVPTPFVAQLEFRENSECCMTAGISAPGALDHAEGYVHLRTETGHHGWHPHPGDYMRPNAPLTAGFLQGTFRDGHGNQGTFRFKLDLQSTGGSGLMTVSWVGFLTFYDSGQAENVQTILTRQQPVSWDAGMPA
jgi:hypothetical protein